MTRFTCLQCGKEVVRRNAGKAKFCSRSCSAAYRAAQRAHAGKVSGGPCLQCGGPIERRWAHELRTAVFCGNACKRAYQALHPTNEQGKKVTIPCEICGKPVTFYPSVQPVGRYCSMKCKGVGHSRMMTGRRPSQGHYSSRTTFRVMVRREFVDRCAICGWTEAANDVCHIIPVKRGGLDNAENIVMLCPNHHRLFDQGKLSVDAVLDARRNCLKPAQSTPASSSSA